MGLNNLAVHIEAHFPKYWSCDPIYRYPWCLPKAILEGLKGIRFYGRVPFSVGWGDHFETHRDGIEDLEARFIGELNISRVLAWIEYADRD